MKVVERWSEHTRRLPAIAVGKHAYRNKLVHLQCPRPLLITPAQKPPEPKPSTSLPIQVLNTGNPSNEGTHTPLEASQPVDPTAPTTTKPTKKKPPLAMRRLMDHNKKGLLEQ